MDIKEHIADLREAANLDISVLHGTSLEIMKSVAANHTKTADTMERLLAVYEAAQLLSDHIHVPESGEHLARPDHHRALVKALTEVKDNE